MKPAPTDMHDGDGRLLFGLRPIPKRFHSVYVGGRFEQCTLCEAPLLANGQQYLIEKHFNGSEATLEYATCEKCTEQLHSELSQESIQRLEQRFRRAFRAFEEARGLDECGMLDGIAHRCLFCHAHARAKVCKERIIVGWFRGIHMEISAQLPLMICYPCAEALEAQLSETTRRRLEDFANEILDFPPDFADLPSRPSLLLI
ncbi:MAG: hypothetical protein ACFBZ8_05055 [Opitutales bacterium]